MGRSIIKIESTGPCKNGHDNDSDRIAMVAVDILAGAGHQIHDATWEYCGGDVVTLPHVSISDKEDAQALYEICGNLSGWWNSSGVPPRWIDLPDGTKEAWRTAFLRARLVLLAK